VPSLGLEVQNTGRSKPHPDKSHRWLDSRNSWAQGHARRGSGRALRGRDEIARPLGKKERRAIPRGFHVPGLRGRVRELEVPKWHLKLVGRTALPAPRFHRTRRSHAVERAPERPGRAGPYRDHACLRSPSTDASSQRPTRSSASCSTRFASSWNRQRNRRSELAFDRRERENPSPPAMPRSRSRSRPTATKRAA